MKFLAAILRVALHEIVVALEPRFFLNMRPTKASMGSQLGNMLTIVAKTWVLYHVPRFNVVLPFFRSPFTINYSLFTIGLAVTPFLSCRASSEKSPTSFAIERRRDFSPSASK